MGNSPSTIPNKILSKQEPTESLQNDLAREPVKSSSQQAENTQLKSDSLQKSETLKSNFAPKGEIPEEEKLIEQTADQPKSIQPSPGIKARLKIQNQLSLKAYEDERKKLEILKPKNLDFDDFKPIERVINGSFFMKTLDKVCKKEIIRRCSLALVRKGNFIFREGQNGTFLYVIKSGSVELTSEAYPRQILSDGDSFGELALLYETAREHTAFTLTNCFLWCIERKHYRRIVDHVKKVQYEFNRKIIDSITILRKAFNRRAPRL